MVREGHVHEWCGKGTASAVQLRATKDAGFSR
jgi:hypothetical protein